MTALRPTLRKALSIDAPRITRIYVESWNAGFENLMPLKDYSPELVQRWEEDLRDVSRQWWIAELGNTMVGFVGVGPSRDPTDTKLGELDTIAVAPMWWRKRIGQLLMTKALNLLTHQDYREAVLWTLANYERGQRFYEATGWKQDGGVRDAGRQIRYRYVLKY
jgi:N-acetylglutamate synthase-like GNAT family acetyltransferase